MRRTEILSLLVCTFTVLSVFLAVAVVRAETEQWWEHSGQSHDYDLGGVNVLVVLGEDFDYHELMVIKGHWEEWGAKVTLAGTDRTLKGHLWRVTDKGWDRSETTAVKVDLLLSGLKSEEFDLGSYDVLFFPGGNGPENLLLTDRDGVTGLVRRARSLGLILAAICHGPLVLAESDVVRGKTVTGYPDIADNLTNAGGNYAVETAIVDGELVTGNFPYFETFAVKVAERILYGSGGGPSEDSPFETNPVLKNIKERRSVRRFEKTDLEDGLVRDLVKAASWAPSADNEQPWRFVAVRDTAVKIEIVNVLIDKMRPFYEAQGYPLEAVRGYWASLFAAPVHVLAFYSESVEEDSDELRSIALLHRIQGVSAACQNLLLAAKSLGLGSVWIGGTLVVEDDIKALVAAPPDAKLVTVIGLGYPAQSPLPPVRKSVAEVLFYEKWGQTAVE